MNSSLLLKPWQYLFSAALTLLVWGLLISPSFAGSCKTRTITNHSLPASSYTVDATPIEEVIAKHTASVVWAECTTGSPESASQWLNYFYEGFGVKRRPFSGSQLVEPHIWSYTLNGQKVPSNKLFVNSAYKRIVYDINCQDEPYDYCFDLKGDALKPPVKSSRLNSGLQIYVDITISGEDSNGIGCIKTNNGGDGVWPVGGSLGAATGTGTGTYISLNKCTTVRMDYILSIVKTKPFSAPGLDVATINVTRSNKFKYSVCDIEAFCTATNSVLGAPFVVFNSNKPLTINLTKTVRPIPTVKKCIVQLQSAPTRSRL